MPNQMTTTNRQLLAEKELSYLKDYLSWELLAMKKCNEAASHCQDEQIRNLLIQTGRKHQQHYEQILTHLQ